MNDKKQRTDSLDGGGQYPDVGMSGIAVNVQCETTPPNSIAEVGPTVFLKQNLSEVNFTTDIFHDKCSDPGPPTVKKENISPSCDDFTSSEQLYSFESTIDPLFQVKTENEDQEDDYLFHTYIECKSEAPDHLSVHDQSVDSEQNGENPSHNFPINNSSESAEHDRTEDSMKPEIVVKKEADKEAASLRYSIDACSNMEPSLPKTEVGEADKSPVCNLKCCSVTLKIESNIEKPFSCSLCSKSFAEQKLLNRHIKRHKGERPFSCSECPASFARNYELQRHQSGHSKETPFSCCYCPATFSHKSKLYRHQTAHMKEKSVSCEHCSATFTSKDSLRSHVVKHTGERLYICSHCSAAFVRKNNLRDHIRTHTGTKPYTCKFCSVSFTQLCHLTRHISTHTGEKPYSCSHCSASFAQKSHLKSHILLHSGKRPFKCSQCSASFTRNGNLKRHILVHKGGTSSS